MRIWNSSVWGNIITFVELELTFEANHMSLKFFGNDESQLEYLSAQLILAWLSWVFLFPFMVKSCVAFETSFLNCGTWVLLVDKQKFKFIWTHVRLYFNGFSILKYICFDNNWCKSLNFRHSIEELSMNTIVQKETRQLKERRNKGPRIAWPIGRVAETPRYPLIFKCAQF